MSKKILSSKGKLLSKKQNLKEVELLSDLLDEPLKKPKNPIVIQESKYEVLEQKTEKKIRYIVHLADIHIRKNEREQEYRYVFNKLYEKLKELGLNNDNCLIYVGGDIVNSKTNLTPELVDVTAEFLTTLSSIRPTILIAGNHDATLANKNRLDSLSPIVNAINHPNLFYLKDSGLYILGDILFNHYSVFDEPENYIKFKDIPKVYLNETRYNIALFHGPVNDAITDVGYKVTSRTITNKLFEGHQIVLLGDIHKHQVILNPEMIVSEEELDKLDLNEWEIIEEIP
jgi:DNA repair exonuclease SbcCD nuclease subunit